MKMLPITDSSIFTPTLTFCAAVFIVIIIALFILPLAIQSWIVSSRSKSKTLLPPKAKHAWPIIGHLHMKLDHTSLGSMADEYGPFFTVQLGWTPAVVVSSWEIAKEIFTAHDVAVSGQPKFMAAEYFGYNFAMFGFTQYGPYWREMRKVSSVHLLSSAKVDSFKHIRVFEIEESIRELYKLWLKESKKGGLIKVEMKQLILDMTFNIIVRMVCGKRYYGTSGGSEEAKKCQEALREFFDKIGSFLLADSFPFLRCFDFGGHVKSMKKKSEELDVIVQGWLDEHRMEREKFDGNYKDDRDFMDVLLRILDGIPQQLGGFDSDTVNKATCLDLIVGGNDTTAVTLTWALSLLLNNPHTLKKAQEELNTQVGQERQVSESDITNLPYLQAIVKETFRLYPPAPLSSPREFTQDCSVAGYHIPKGTRLILNLYKIHRDPTVWSVNDDASKFRPERFLDGGTHGEVDVRSGGARQFVLMPFGGGRRKCPGSNLALAVVHLALANFLHAFEFCTSDEEAAPSVDMEEGFGLTVMRKNPLNVLLAPRLPDHLYDYK